jgi:hypothetical protein
VGTEASVISVIEDALRAEDVEGLLELGAPRDEYSHEAERIASELRALGPNDATEDRVADLIANVWANSFELSQEDIEKRYTALHRVARQILASHAKGTEPT